MDIRRALSAIAASTLILAGLAPAFPAAAVTATPEAITGTLAHSNRQQIIDVFNGINAYRASLGVAPVKFNVTVSEMAEDWSDNMAAKSVFLHNPSYSSDPRVADRWTTAGEIIAARGDVVGQGLVNQWIQSPPHAQNMRNPAFTSIGVGISVSSSSTYRMYGTVNLFAFSNTKAPAGMYATAKDYFDGKPALGTVQPTPAPPFVDSSQSGFQDAIAWMKKEGITTGYKDGTYRPFGSVSREAMAAFIFRLAGTTYTPPSRSPFKDVPTTHLFYKEIAFMNAAGISTGWTDGTYRPYELVSREAMAAFMNRFAGAYCGIAGARDYVAPPSPTFSDSMPSDFYREIEWMRFARVTNGWPDGTYRPSADVSREAMAAFMQRLDGYVAANPGVRCSQR